MSMQSGRTEITDFELRSRWRL